MRQFESQSPITVVKTQISNLRTKIASAIGEEAVLRTVGGIGYTARRGGAATGTRGVP